MINAVGGKSVNLGVLSSAGLPVPGGFCVTTEAYRLVVQR
ncbi:MAG TPA: PEP/pyruvate-binding domain-containing protein, partial [Propionibacteriaceae bacterium]|nr:PEP/pyruvate-binding domain-containing protein [Propionibacteriaceae bacterium]